MDDETSRDEHPADTPPAGSVQSPDANPFAAALDELVGPARALAARARHRAAPRPPAAPAGRGVSASSVTQAFGVERTVQRDLEVVDAILASRNHLTARAVSIRYGCVVVACPKSDVWALRVDASQIVELWQHAGVTASSLRTTSP